MPLKLKTKIGKEIKMKKTKELVSLKKNTFGCYVATIYDRDTQTYENRWFSRYIKKEIFALLRADNISISRGV